MMEKLRMTATAFLVIDMAVRVNGWIRQPICKFYNFT